MSNLRLGSRTDFLFKKNCLLKGTVGNVMVIGANPMTSKFITTTPACSSRLERFSKVEENVFVFKMH
jgi:hypothetical protein